MSIYESIEWHFSFKSLRTQSSQSKLSWTHFLWQFQGCSNYLKACPVWNLVNVWVSFYRIFHMDRTTQSTSKTSVERHQRPLHSTDTAEMNQPQREWARRASGRQQEEAAMLEICTRAENSGWKHEPWESRRKKETAQRRNGKWWRRRYWNNCE